MNAQESLNRWAGKLKLLSIVAAVVAFFLILRTLPIEQMLASLRTWVESLGVWGPVVYGLVYIAATIFMLPASLLTLASGAIFGLGLATLVVSLGSTIGAACAFLIGRYLLREKVSRMMASRPKLKAVDDAIDEGGWKIVGLLRLSPAVPFNVLNYLFGLTPVGFWPCVLASWVAMLPGTFLYVYIGYTATELASGGGGGGSLGKQVATVVGLLATVAVTVYVTKLAKRKLDERTQVDEVEADERAAAAESATAEPDGWPTGALVTAGIAALLVVAAVYVQEHPDALRQLFAGS